MASRHWIATIELMEGGESVVALAGLSTPLQDNLDTVYLDVLVHPAHRGQGVATALVEQALVPAVRESGRTLLTVWGPIPAEGDPDDPQLPVNRLTARLGLSRKNIAVCRLLDLPMEGKLLDRLDAEAAAHMDGYRILEFGDEVPEQHLAAYGTLLRQIELDEPDEDVEHEAPEYTPERIRLAEERRRRAGTTSVLAVAVAPDGTFVGNSEVVVHDGPDSTIGWQENTLVMPEHRGHRLGLALKIATHRRLAAEAPRVRVVATWNSHVNPWMIAVNEKLGYRPALREVTYQGRPSWVG